MPPAHALCAGLPTPHAETTEGLPKPGKLFAISKRDLAKNPLPQVHVRSGYMSTLPGCHVCCSLGMKRWSRQIASRQPSRLFFGKVPLDFELFDIFVKPSDF